jgi:transcriptional regulator with XRE-family HTH domain
MVDELEKDLIEDLRDPEFSGLYGSECARSEYGLTLFHARQALHLTQKQLAEKLGVRQPYIAQLESGEANPTLGAAGKLLAALGLKMVIGLEPLSPPGGKTILTNGFKKGAPVKQEFDRAEKIRNQYLMEINNG